VITINCGGRWEVFWSWYLQQWPPARMHFEDWSLWRGGFHIGPLQIRFRRINSGEVRL
jgi:hypothetical protein